MRGRSVTTAALWLLALSFCFAANASVSSELQTAVKLFGAQNYDSAIMHLALVVSDDPQNAEAHYLMGCCYTRKHLLCDAEREYETAARLDARGQVGVMARAALKSLSPEAMMNAATKASEYQASACRANIAPPVSVQSVRPGNSARMSIAKSKVSKGSLAGKTAGSDSQGRRPANSFDSALALIKNQADAEKLRHTSLGEIQANAQVATGNGRADQLRVEKKLTIENMRNSQISNYKGTSYPRYTDAQIQAVSDSYDERINLTVSQANELADKQRKYTAAKVSDLDQVVDSLSSQMSSSHGVRLLPKGTNLYIRNYAEGASSKPVNPIDSKHVLPEQLSADQDKLILTPDDRNGKMVTRVIPAPVAASQDKLHLRQQGQKPTNTQLDVHGRITHM